MSLSPSDCSQIGPPKSVGERVRLIYRGGNLCLKMFKIEVIGCLLCGGCHHPNDESESLLNLGKSFQT